MFTRGTLGKHLGKISSTRMVGRSYVDDEVGEDKYIILEISGDRMRVMYQEAFPDEVILLTRDHLNDKVYSKIG